MSMKAREESILAKGKSNYNKKSSELQTNWELKFLKKQDENQMVLEIKQSQAAKKRLEGSSRS